MAGRLFGSFAVTLSSRFSCVRMLRLAILLVSVCALSSLPLAAQDGDTTASSTAQSTGTDDVAGSAAKQVNVLATVRDKHGKILSDLTQGDFVVQEDGQAITLSSFARQSSAPLKLGLLVETSVSQRSFLDQEKTGSKIFLDQLLGQNDAAFLIHFDREVELLQDITSSKAKLESALEQLQTASFSEPQSSPDDPDSGDNPRSGGRGRGMRRSTTLYDGIYLACDEVIQKPGSRKVLVVLSDGVDRGSKESFESAIEAAQRADAMVYAIYLKGEEEFEGHHGDFGGPRMGGPMGGGGRRGGGGGYPREARPDGKKILEQIAAATGGHMFEVSKKQTIDQIYGDIEEDLRNQYLLGFIPGKSDSAGYHRLTATVKAKDAQIQVRSGFYLAQ